MSKYGPSGMMAIPPGAFAVLGHEDVEKNLICVDDLIRLMLAVVRGGPEPGSVFHLVNPRTVSVRELYSAMVELLGITCLRLAPSLPATLSEEEEALRHGIEVYEPYIFSQEPSSTRAGHARSWATRQSIGPSNWTASASASSCGSTSGNGWMRP